ncbi:MAG: enoyl-CoA hydratase/isomerase family protein [Candidatus Obscuribacterales bacterium]|nr:enoyl-CoA hydratase/isomerase family protein [Candidatus Obscuribacterales bacterium]
MTKNDSISSWLSGEIGYLELNRPELKNAISYEMWQAIPARLQLLKDAGAKLVILRGKGAIFASGADLSELVDLQTFESAERNWHGISRALNFVADFSLPTIAAIEGPCIGGGCLLAIACDLRYATNDAVFGVPIAKLGIVLDKENLNRLGRLVGLARAKELIFRGNLISAPEAREIGLVNELFAGVELEERIAAIALEIGANSLQSIQECKLALSPEGDASVRSLADSHRAVVSSYLSPEFKERSSRVLKND